MTNAVARMWKFGRDRARRYLLKTGDYALRVAGAGDWAGGAATVRDEAGYETYAVVRRAPGRPDDGVATFTVAHGYPTAAPTWAPRSVGVDLVLDWSDSAADAVVEVYRVDGPATAEPTLTPAPAVNMLPDGVNASARPTASPTAAPTHRKSALIAVGQWLTPLATIDAAPDPEALTPTPGKRQEYAWGGRVGVSCPAICSPAAAAPRAVLHRGVAASRSPSRRRHDASPRAAPWLRIVRGFRAGATSKPRNIRVAAAASPRLVSKRRLFAGTSSAATTRCC